jgi:predicted RND superfamily exporter protein
MPIFISIFHNKLDGKKHKTFIPSFNFIAKNMNFNKALAVLIFMIIISGGSYYLESKVDFIYGEPSVSETQDYVDDNFDLENRLALIISTDESNKINQFEKDLVANVDGLVESDLASGKLPVVSYEGTLDRIKNKLLYCNFNEEGIHDEMCSMLPDATMENIDMVALGVLEEQGVTKETFINEKEGYERIFIEIKDPLNEIETKEIFSIISDIRETANDNFSDSLLTGESVALYDLKDLTAKDGKVVLIITILLVALVIAITFKSLFIPILLVLIIQSAIWMNMSVAAITGNSLIFIGYIIVSSVQLGATIDYSILITENYMHNRFINKHSKKDAIANAMNASIHPVLVSALSLMIGGFSLAIFSKGSVAAIGVLIGRGAFMSIILSIFVLPYLLFLFDKVINKTTYKRKSKLKEK